MKSHYSHRINKTILALSISCLALGSGSALASDASSEGSGHHYPVHVVGGFVGGTATDESVEFSFGAEYEFHFMEHFGVGVIVEHTPDSVHFSDGATIALAAFHAHPWKGLRLTAAVGAEVGHGDEVHEAEAVEGAGEHAPEPTAHARAAEVHHESAEEAGSEVLVRLGIAYDFKIAESMAVAPTVNVDFVDGEENVVFGMLFSYHF